MKAGSCLIVVKFLGDSVGKMSDHLVLYVDRVIRPSAVEPVTEPLAEGASVPRGDGPGSEATGPSCSVDENERIANSESSDEEEPLIQMAECRICQEEDSVENLETPCACSGSLKV